MWKAVLSSGGVRTEYLGQDGDVPVPAEFGGPSAVESAIFRAAGGLWAVRNVTRVYLRTADDFAATR